MGLLPKENSPLGDFKNQFRSDIILLLFLVKKVRNGRSTEAVLHSKQSE